MDHEMQLSRPDGVDAGEAVVVAIRIPPDPDYVPILRAASAQLATKLDCTPTEIADLRLAVDEACGLLLRNSITLYRGSGAEGEGLSALFVVRGPILRITFSLAADAVATPETGEFGWTILTALVDGFTWRVEGSEVRVELTKRRASRQ
ncbi:MAG: ATP-binding protein [Catenulispora sp.]